MSSLLIPPQKPSASRSSSSRAVNCPPAQPSPANRRSQASANPREASPDDYWVSSTSPSSSHSSSASPKTPHYFGHSTPASPRSQPSSLPRSPASCYAHLEPTLSPQPHLERIEARRAEIQSRATSLISITVMATDTGLKRKVVILGSPSVGECLHAVQFATRPSTHAHQARRPSPNNSPPRQRITRPTTPPSSPRAQGLSSTRARTTRWRLSTRPVRWVHYSIRDDARSNLGRMSSPSSPPSMPLASTATCSSTLLLRGNRSK